MFDVYICVRMSGCLMFTFVYVYLGVFYVYICVRLPWSVSCLHLCTSAWVCLMFTFMHVWLGVFDVYKPERSVNALIT